MTWKVIHLDLQSDPPSVEVKVEPQNSARFIDCRKELDEGNERELLESRCDGCGVVRVTEHGKRIKESENR